MTETLPAINLDDLDVRRVLAIGAHPDDCEFSAGGTLARLVRRGCEVTLAVCSDGRRGGREQEDMSAVRSVEQERACARLGVAAFESLGRRDGEVACDEALRADIVRLIRRYRPDLVLTHDPATLWRRFGRITFLGHSDHRATGQAVLDAIYPRSGNPNFYPEQLSEVGVELFEPTHLWLFDTAGADARVDIGDTLEAKVDALLEHESQSEAAGGLVSAARAAAARMGREHGDGETPCEVFVAHRLRWASS